MPQLISAEDGRTIQGMFAGTTSKARLILFTAADNCPYCEQTDAIVQELQELVPESLEVEVRDVTAGSEYGIDNAPALLFVDEVGNDLGVRYYGIPAGYEFAALIEALSDLAKQEQGLSEESRRQVQAVEQELEIKVFVTPT